MSDLKGLKLSGMKKTSWYTPKGKQMGLITFGKKKDVIIPLDDYEWENVLNIDIKKEDVDGKKYHSGTICAGVTNGFAGI